jgi:hypothetical protein
VKLNVVQKTILVGIFGFARSSNFNLYLREKLNMETGRGEGRGQERKVKKVTLSKSSLRANKESKVPTLKSGALNFNHEPREKSN